jgi:hypothetical protein
MAKRNEYPTDRSFEARMNAVRIGLVNGGSAAETLRDAAEHIQDARLKDLFLGRAEHFQQAISLAFRALNGEDEQP